MYICRHLTSTTTFHGNSQIVNSTFHIGLTFAARTPFIRYRYSPDMSVIFYASSKQHNIHLSKIKILFPTRVRVLHLYLVDITSVHLVCSSSLLKRSDQFPERFSKQTFTSSYNNSPNSTIPPLSIYFI